MTTLWIILFALAGSFLSTAGGLILLWRIDLAKKVSLFLISFAAGVLLGVAFLDLLPEALEGLGNIEHVAVIILSAIVIFFLLERFLWWYHYHRTYTDEHANQIVRTEEGIEVSKVYILLGGDAIHNFIDGILIATAFLINIPLGIAVSIGIIAHELPQEIADFGIMIDAGFSRIKTLLLNIAAASTTLMGALFALYIVPNIAGVAPFIIAFAAGVFIYIALSDLIPEIHHRSERKHAAIHFLLFVSGIFLIGWVI